MKVHIIIVNYGTADLAIASILSLRSNQENLHQLTVSLVDNASINNDVELLTQAIQSNHWQDWVTLIPSKMNGGFGYGCNIGIRQALIQHADYIMLLNPDTLVKPNAITALAKFLDEHPQVGIVGSQLQNADGHIENSAHRFHTIAGELLDGARFGPLTRLLNKYEVTPPRQENAHVCDWVSGSAMMIRKKVIQDIGLIDEAFFLYFEEVDFFKRAANAGWQTWYVPTSKVMHIEGASTGIKSTKRRPQYWYHSRRRYIIKHHGVLGLIFADCAWMVGRLSFMARRFFKLGAQGVDSDPKWLMRDLLIGDILALLTGQAWRQDKEKIAL